MNRLIDRRETWSRLSSLDLALLGVVFTILGASSALAQSCDVEQVAGECLLRLPQGELRRLLDERETTDWPQVLEGWYQSRGLPPLVGDSPLEVVSIDLDLLLARSDVADCRQFLRTRELDDPNEAIEHVENNYVYRALVKPGDLWYKYQWGLKNTRQGTPDCGKGTKGIDIRAEEAWEEWDKSLNKTEVVVAVVDSGIFYGHPDLSANIWKNEKEIDGNNLDDDRNHYDDDIRGWDFVSPSADPRDVISHGTHIASIIGAVWDSPKGIIGVAGIARNVLLMPLRFLNAAKSGTLCNAIQAIDYAIDNGAQVVNLSWGSCVYSEGLKRVLEKGALAQDGAGVLFVAAAGNDLNRDNDQDPLYPAAYDLDNVLSVTSINNHGAVCDSWGRKSVDVAAPGRCIAGLNGQDPDDLLWLDGSSMATAFVSGIAALVLSAHPGLTAVDLKQRILDSARPLDRQVTNVKDYPTVTGGYVDAYKAIK